MFRTARNYWKTAWDSCGIGYAEVLYVDNSLDLVEFFDAYGFDVYSFSTKNEKINYGDYQAQIVPGGDSVHCSLTAH